MTHLANQAAEIAMTATKLNNCVNGNPRYYVAAYEFKGDSGEYYRPAFANKYRGKAYGAGWVFTSYNLESCIRRSLEEVTA
jgi:hypothetical protein